MLNYLLKIVKGTLSGIRANAGWLFWLYLPVILIFGAVAVLSQLIPHLTIPELLRDVATLGELPFYAGSVSQFGLLLWSSAATLCYFTYFSLKLLKYPRKEALNFLLFASILTTYLMLDDTYMLHEEFFPDFLQIIPEEVIIFILGLSMLAFLYFNWQEIMRGDYWLMLLAFAFFGTSIVFDSIPTRLYENIYFIEKVEHLVEDGAKMAAIFTWVAFYARYAYHQFSELINQKNAAA